MLTSGLWGYLLAGLAAAGGLLFGWLKNQQSKTQKAQSDAQVADLQKQAVVSQFKVVADDQKAAAAADAATAASGAQRVAVDKAVSAMTDDEVQQELKNEFSR